MALFFIVLSVFVVHFEDDPAINAQNWFSLKITNFKSKCYRQFHGDCNEKIMVALGI